MFMSEICWVERETTDTRDGINNSRGTQHGGIKIACAKTKACGSRTHATTKRAAENSIKTVWGGRTTAVAFVRVGVVVSKHVKQGGLHSICSVCLSTVVCQRARIVIVWRPDAPQGGAIEDCTMGENNEA